MVGTSKSLFLRLPRIHLQRRTYKFVEQDFLNDYFRTRRVVLGHEYHCLAEDLGHEARGRVAANGERLCKIVEYSSCDLGGSGTHVPRSKLRA
jgi:hypothetical protein